MSDIAIKVENLSKLYHIGTQKSGSLRDTLSHKWHQLLGKSTQTSSEEFWALQNVSFEIKQGEAVGIIGKNGAGKSTLLKILSRITKPTKGRIEMNGRVASLLEVGTGFHPDLSGRENIYLNGTILGMKRQEIKAKFDQIIDFSGVEKFIDTPVKRYSSGMYVRLAFAVAAHLESEILILDEVLAVGDAEFQKKCLGKMDDVAHKEGRSVIFVSHDLAAVNKLCQSAILLKAGNIFMQGATSKVIDEYLNVAHIRQQNNLVWPHPRTAPGDETAKIHSISLLNSQNSLVSRAYLDEPLLIEVQYWCLQPNAPLNVSLSLFTANGDYVLASASVTDTQWYRKPHPVGLYKSVCRIPGNFLNEGQYLITCLLIGSNNHLITQVDHAVSIEMVDLGKERGDYYGYWGGVVRPVFEWHTKFIAEKMTNSII